MSHISLEYLWPVVLKTTLRFEAGHAATIDNPVQLGQRRRRWVMGWKKLKSGGNWRV